jgi:hypothetical protein
MHRKDSVFESTSYYHRRFPGNRQLQFERCQIFTSVCDIVTAPRAFFLRVPTHLSSRPMH